MFRVTHSTTEVSHFYEKSRIYSSWQSCRFFFYCTFAGQWLPCLGLLRSCSFRLQRMCVYACDAAVCKRPKRRGLRCSSSKTADFSAFERNRTVKHFATWTFNIFIYKHLPRGLQCFTHAVFLFSLWLSHHLSTPFPSRLISFLDRTIFAVPVL